MILSVNGLSDYLEKYVSENYEFRNNLVQKIIGKETLEYRRADSDVWKPISRFLYKEKRKISVAARHHSDKGVQYPDWMIKKVALKHGHLGQHHIENQDYYKILDQEPVQVNGVKPRPQSKRAKVELTTGDKCYVCFGMKKQFWGKKFVALPAVVESVKSENLADYYNVFILKFNKKKDKVEYFGRHMVLNTELGRTAEEAVQNVAFSQAIY